MSLSALPTALVVPPINLLLPCVAGALMLRRWPWAARMLLATGLGGLLMLSLPVVAEVLLLPLEAPAPAPAGADPPGAIVILSAEAVRDGNGYAPGPLTLERLRAGAALHRRTGLPILVSGGAVEGQATTLAAVMARSLQDDFGTPARWTEDRSQDTRENAVLSAPVLRAAGVRSAYLVTHAWHMPRSVLAFAGTGVEVTPAPVRLDRPADDRANGFVPRAGAWQTSYFALHEWIGLAAARLIPGRGSAPALASPATAAPVPPPPAAR